MTSRQEVFKMAEAEVSETSADRTFKFKLRQVTVPVILDGKFFK